jgi:hypothetical protein
MQGLDSLRGQRESQNAGAKIRSVIITRHRVATKFPSIKIVVSGRLKKLYSSDTEFLTNRSLVKNGSRASLVGLKLRIR